MLKIRPVSGSFFISLQPVWTRVFHRALASPSWGFRPAAGNEPTWGHPESDAWHRWLWNGCERNERRRPVKRRVFWRSESRNVANENLKDCALIHTSYSQAFTTQPPILCSYLVCLPFFTKKKKLFTQQPPCVHTACVLLPLIGLPVPT